MSRWRRSSVEACATFFSELRKQSHSELLEGEELGEELGGGRGGGGVGSHPYMVACVSGMILANAKCKARGVKNRNVATVLRMRCYR